MKVLSIKQPWASLIVQGLKDIENRTWKTNFRGRILIHASQNDFDFRGKMTSEYQREYINKIQKPYIHGAIIGSVEIVDCIESTSDQNQSWGDLYCYHWKLRNAKILREPIFDVKGKLGLWEYNK